MFAGLSIREEKHAPKTSSEAFEKIVKPLAKYIELLGGSAVLIGGVKIGQEFGAQKYNYFIQIGMTGKMPKKPESINLPKGKGEKE